jgi:hypothetical protein
MTLAQPRAVGVAISPKLVAVLFALSLSVHHAQADNHLVKRHALDNSAIDVQQQHPDGRESLSLFVKETMLQEEADEKEEDKEEEEEEQAPDAIGESRNSTDALTATNGSHANSPSGETIGPVAVNKTEATGSAGNQTIGIQAKANQGLDDKGTVSKIAVSATSDSAVPDAAADTAAPCSQTTDDNASNDHEPTEPPVKEERPMKHDSEELEEKAGEQEEVDAWEQHMLACFKDMAKADRNKDDFLSPHEASMHPLIGVKPIVDSELFFIKLTFIPSPYSMRSFAISMPIVSLFRKMF